MYPLPQGIPTFVTIPELQLLQRHAHRARHVLEIGTQYGYTCIGMALAGAWVSTVDPHDQGPANNPDTWEQFLENCQRHGFRMASVAGGEDACLIDGTCILAYRRRIEECPDFGGDRFGLAFIDGDHSYEAVLRDFEITERLLRSPAWVAFHDVTPRWPGVWRATQELENEGYIEKLEQVGFLAVYQVTTL